jgi:S-adenosylmethionine decarboxylase
MSMANEFGKHYLVELIDCDLETIKYLETAKAVFMRAVQECNATYMGDAFHQFEPHGVSGVVLIAESHMSFHTWPESGYVGADIFTCGTEMDPDIAIAVLKEGFGAKNAKVSVHVRGY